MNNTEIYLNELKNNLGDRLDSVFVYGAKSGIPVYDLKNDINLMVIVNRLKAQDLKTCAKATLKWTRNTRENPVPVFMSTAEWFSSSDIYPMEYADIKDRHHILYGEDLINSVEVNRDDLRLQCEQETKNLLMRFRKFYIMNAENKKLIDEMIRVSVKSCYAIFKTILRLKEISVPINKKEILDKMSELTIIDKIFYECMTFPDTKCYKLYETQETAQNFINAVDRLLAYTNNIK